MSLSCDWVEVLVAVDPPPPPVGVACVKVDRPEVDEVIPLVTSDTGLFELDGPVAIPDALVVEITADVTLPVTPADTLLPGPDVTVTPVLGAPVGLEVTPLEEALLLVTVVSVAEEPESVVDIDVTWLAADIVGTLLILVT